MGVSTSNPPDMEYDMTLPHPDLFKDIHSDSDVPKVSDSSITSYYSAVDKVFETQKYKQLYEERLVSFVKGQWSQ